jgi:group I intron endonuclease
MNMLYYKMEEEPIESITEGLQELTTYDRPFPEDIVGHIYMATCKTSEKSYIGQTRSLRLDRNKWRLHGFERRWREHLQDAIRNTQKKQCTVLNNAIRKYGNSDWELVLLYECKIDDLDHYEKEFIAKHNTMAPNGYNLTSGGNAGTTVSDEHRKRISDSMKKVHQKEGMTQIYSDAASNRFDTSKLEKVNKHIEHIEICRIYLNKSKSPKGIAYNNIIIRFYDIKYRAVIISGKDNNGIKYGGQHVTIDDALLRVITLLSFLKNIKVVFLDKNLEVKYRTMFPNNHNLIIEDNTNVYDEGCIC